MSEGGQKVAHFRPLLISFYALCFFDYARGPNVPLPEIFPNSVDLSLMLYIKIFDFIILAGFKVF